MSYLPSFHPSAISHPLPIALFHPLIPSTAPPFTPCSAPTGRDRGLFLSLPDCQLLSRPETKPRPQIAMICNVTPGEHANGEVGIIKPSSQNGPVKMSRKAAHNRHICSRKKRWDPAKMERCPLLSKQWAGIIIHMYIITLKTKPFITINAYSEA
ncbi:hypothetical protein ILYODFUR_018668 [Ilyodon furcidens]|uniref:Uncharacterized protein n=1 Tax=Ilyodon furcidens TaxID=33524 RepID=A0ABV0V474_9TELE